MKKLIITSKTHGKKIVLLDDKDYNRVIKHNWSIQKTRILFYPKTKNIYLHRFILNINDKNIFIDHINGNTLDNRRKNLRICSRKENLRNRGKPNTNKSGYKGVCWHYINKKWASYIWINNKRKHLGLFKKKEDAARAYNEAALKYHKKFANLNKISEKI